MKDNAVNVNGIDVYIHKIYDLTDEFINNKLADPEMIMGNNSYIMDNLMDYIYNNLFKPDKDYIRINNKLSILDYDDILSINNIWEIFKDILGRYGKKPTILRFSRMTGISRKQIQRWRDKDVASLRSLTIQKWYEDCECSSHSGATESGRIGDIFDCKANYGYTEQAQRIEIVDQNKPQISMQQLTALRKERRELPQKPDFD